MRATAPKELWSGVFAAVGDLTEGSGALFSAGPEGLHLAVLDPNNVLFAEAHLPRHLFADFEAAGEESLAVDLEKLKNFVAAGTKGGEWELSTATDERGPVIFLKSGGLSFTTRPAPPESAKTVKGLAIEFKATVEAPADSLRDLLRTLRKTAKQAELAALRVKEGAASIQILDGDMEPLADLALGPGETMARGEALTHLSAELLTPALSKLLALKPSELRAELADRGPARLTALLESGGEVSVLMAPREPSEPEPPEAPEEEPEAGPAGEPQETPDSEEVPEWEAAGPLVLALSVLALPRPPAPEGPKKCARCRLPDSPWTRVGPDGLCDFDREVLARAKGAAP
ncbi:MAG: hypothetical protein QXT68_07350 [Halobacteria archaeon]